ncbi:CHAT domain-containing protein [Sporomusa acidovorans]|uniref:CHAT domain-containing protein n=1 Tax=Sporomusa acidovorans (strain ATCC 49682 / DSM 3132 / Mol) TaxID=1123286 RepID=A0ABZ3J5H6_SPOA4|nr:CHAT domain-containing protein [Sporomusa acidovorans]OZC23941.1 CHAT domain protein [Sporomusa acidovorans DSM 3132]SDF31716.1 CHAT domain-containing protein [Sporomusa acidovorans]
MVSTNDLRASLLRKQAELTRLKIDKTQALQQIADHNQVFSRTASAGLSLKAAAGASAGPAVETAKSQIKRGAQKAIDLMATIAELEQEVAELEQRLAAADQLAQTKKARKQPQRAKPIAQKAAEQVTVLFLAANALKDAPLELDAEARDIQENIRKSARRDAINFVTRWATQPLDILQAINETNPQLVHFSGHGSENDELVLQGDDGKPKMVRLAAIVQVMLSASDTIRLVFFNVCFSNEEAEAVVKYVEAAVGMNTAVSDEAARVFAAQFYSALGFGKSLQTAFEQAKAALMLNGIPEENTPKLYVKAGLDPARLVFVKE